MKKFNFSLIILFLVIIISLATGCFIQEKVEFNKTKEEIIKFDKEYWNLAQEYQKENDEYIKKLSNLPTYKIIKDGEVASVIVDKLSWNIDGVTKMIEIKNNYLGYYLTYIGKFKALTIPASLDSFYYTKIKQFDKNVESFQKEISANLKDLAYLESYMDAAKVNFTVNNLDFVEKVVGERDDLFNESEELSHEAGDLSIESDKLRREVYRGYGLDDLITKWQK